MDTETLQRQTVLYDLIDQLRAKGNWCGETHVQKAGYFLEKLAGGALGYDFILYKHGPYSFMLSEELAAMGALRFVDEIITHPNYGPRLKTNPEVAPMLHKNFAAKSTRLGPAMDFVVGKLCDYGVAALERLATALYFTKQEPVDDVEARARKINEVKPHIPLVRALEAVRDVERILAEWDVAQHSAPAEAAL
jgi:uncharacterized protein YwgA